MSTQPTVIEVAKEPIRLGQFLKLANLIQDGWEAKFRIQNGEVEVNDVVETRRGKQLADNDRVKLAGKVCMVHYETAAKSGKV
jgi:ribosome-associated protein